MKCVDVKCIAEGCLVIEAGGLNLSKGQHLTLSAEVAPRILAQYSHQLTKVGDVERPSLNGGWYEMGKQGNPETGKSESPKKATESKPETVSDVADNRSMDKPEAKAKTKIKSKKTAK